MVPDWQTDCVFFSSLLPQRHPLLWQRLAKMLADDGIEHCLLEGTRDIWVRDFMPVQVAAGDFVLFRYQPDYLRGHNELVTPDEVRKAVPQCDRLRMSDINLDGGNVVASSSKVILTDKVYKENPGHPRQALREELTTVLRANCIIIPKEPYDVIGHADGVLRFIDENTVVVNDYPRVDSGYSRRLEAALRRHELAIERLPHFQSDDRHDGIPSAAGCYINYLRIGRLVIVPAFGVREDELACKTLEKLLTEVKVMPLRCEELAWEGGVLNCVSWSVRTP